MKTYLSLVVLFFIIIVNFELAYAQNTVSLKIEPLKICGEDFNDSLSIEISNNTLDSIYLTLDPIEFDVIGENNRWYVNMLHSQYAPCRISFFENSSKGIIEGTGGSNISFLKFPKILIINPGEKTVIRMVFENTKDLFGQNRWDVSFEFWYANHSDINKAFSIARNNYLQQQFENSVISTDFIVINIPRSNIRESFPLESFDTSMYFYKDGINIPFSYQSDCDRILSFFGNKIGSFISN